MFKFVFTSLWLGRTLNTVGLLQHDLTNVSKIKNYWKRKECKGVLRKWFCLFSLYHTKKDY